MRAAAGSGHGFRGQGAVSSGATMDWVQHSLSLAYELLLIYTKSSITKS